jgi:putative MFS transporter
VNSDYIVRNAALIGLPITLVAALLYGFWSSKKTITLLSTLSALPLPGFVIFGNSLAHDHVLLSALLVMPLSGIGSVTAAASSYAAEIYPTLVRSRGTGLISGMSKAGGVLIIAIVAAATTIPSIGMTALIGAVPLIVAMVIFVRAGPETRHRRLEEISQAIEYTAPALVKNFEREG